jgi:secreted protein with Ig-like and vWFA domain
VTPVVKFLNMYHDSEGEFPETLESLASATPKAQNLKLKEATNVGTVWTINYRRTSPQEYAISFNHVHYDVLYKNGEHVATRKAFFR